MSTTRHQQIMQTLVVVSLVVGCRAGPSSSTQALDQFAGHGGAAYTCSGNDMQYNDIIAGTYTVGGNQASRDAVKSALAALPAELKAQVFLQKRSQIVITGDVTSACLGTVFAKAYANQSAKPFASCHKLENGTASIFVGSQPDQIKKTLVRAIGYFLAEIDVNAVTGPAQLNAVFVKSPTLDAVGIDMANLGITFLNDVAANHSFKLSVFAGMLPNSVLAVQDPNARQNVWMSLEGPDSGKRQLFSSYVFAEAIDSYYCSNASRAALVKNFPQTALFLGLNNASGSFGLASPFGFVAPYFHKSFTGGKVPQPTSNVGGNTGAVVPGNRPGVLQQPTIATYYDPTTLQPVKSVSGDGSNYVTYIPPAGSDALGQGQFGQGGYTGYKGGGQYVNIASGGSSNAVYQWVDGQGNKTDYYTSLGANGKWSYNDFRTPTQGADAFPPGNPLAKDSNATSALVAQSFSQPTANVAQPGTGAAGSGTAGDSYVPPSPISSDLPALNPVAQPVTVGGLQDSSPAEVTGTGE